MDVKQKVKAALLSMQRRPWEQGVAAQALLELGDTEAMILLAIDAANLQIEDGRLAMPGERHAVADPAANGEPVLAAARIMGDGSLRRAGQRMADYLLTSAPRAPDGTIYHNTPEPEIWINSLYMVPPFLAVAGYPDEAVRQIEGIKRCLWHPDARLFSHVWNAGEQKFTRGAFWGVGNGWAAAGLIRVIRALPDSMMAQRAELMVLLHAVIDGCIAHQRLDGLFHNVVDDPTTFVETNLAQMLAYSIYRGIAAGVIARNYRGTADRMRAAAHAQVDDYGFVRGVCGAPNFDRSGIAAEAQAFFLLMEAAYADLKH